MNVSLGDITVLTRSEKLDFMTFNYIFLPN